jgi:hypothetical protein
MPVQETATAFVKNVFYKTCFCIGLGTASYYSYGQVQTWVSDKPVTQTTQSVGTTLAEKVNTLFSNSANTVTISQAVQANPQSVEAMSGAYHANSKTFLALTGAKLAAPQALTAPVDPNASPSVSPSPGEATAEKKEGDTKDAATEKKDGEKKDGEEATEAKVASTGPVNEIGLPYSPFAQGQPAAANADAHVSNDAPSTEVANSAASSGLGGGVPSAGSLYSGNGVNTSGNSGSGSSSGGGSYTTGVTTTYTPGTGSTPGFLSASDLALLITPIKASFPDQSENVAGLVCTLGNAPGTVQDCIRNNQYSIHTNRWGISYGLQNDASFVVRSTSGSSQVTVAIDFKLQDLSQNLKDMSFQARPTEVSIHTEARNGKTYKVYEMKMPDLSAYGDNLTSVLATLVYEQPTTAGGTAVMTSDSTLTFVRSHFQTTSTIWDPSGTNRAPAANEQLIIADSVSYSMNLQKSP